MKKERHALRRMFDGRLYVDQGVINGHPMSYNPDDRHFYVHRNDADGTTQAMFKRWGNAVAYARRTDADRITRNNRQELSDVPSHS